MLALNVKHLSLQPVSFRVEEADSLLEDAQVFELHVVHLAQPTRRFLLLHESCYLFLVANGFVLRWFSYFSPQHSGLFLLSNSGSFRIAAIKVLGYWIWALFLGAFRFGASIYSLLSDAGSFEPHCSVLSLRLTTVPRVLQNLLLLPELFELVRICIDRWHGRHHVLHVLGWEHRVVRFIGLLLADFFIHVDWNVLSSAASWGGALIYAGPR